MRRMATVVVCGSVALSLVMGCHRREPRAADDGRRVDADRGEARYPPAPPRSPMARIHEGMTEREVEGILGPPDDSHAYITGKAFVPWYYGPDRSRFACYYRGLGRVVFTGGNRWGLGGGRVIRVEYDPSEDGNAMTR